MTNKPLSNQDKGRLARERLESWLANADQLPARHGRPNKSAIAAAAGVHRDLVQSEWGTDLINRVAERKGLSTEKLSPSTPQDLPAWAKEKISSLESRCSLLYAETAELRRRLKTYEALERHMVQTGTIPR